MSARLSAATYATSPRSAIATLLASALAVSSAHAREPSDPVELVAWRRGFGGTIGDKPIELPRLTRIGAALEGRYCYGACDDARPAIDLYGRWEKGALILEESIADAKGKRNVTGRWRLLAHGRAWRGEWRSPDGKRRLPIVLSETSPAGSTDELRVLAEHAPGDKNDTCESQSPQVLEVRVYRNGRRRQSLKTESIGTCGMFLPEWVDMNFDGHPDLSIALMLPASPNVPYQSWLYDPKQDRFVDAPASLQELASPMLDAARQRVYNYWRSGCCAHGLDVYAWKGGVLEPVESAESRFIPVKRGGKLGYVYSSPTYRHGRIVFSPRIERDAKGGLRLVASEVGDIDFEMQPPSGDRLKIDVYIATADDSPKLASSEPLRWRKLGSGAKTRWCPEVPYLDLDRGRIARERLDDAEACTDTDPARSSGAE